MNSLSNCLSPVTGLYTNRAPETKENIQKGLKVTAFAVAIIALSAAVLASVVVNGFTPANFALNFLGQVTPFGAGAALAGTAALAALVGYAFIRPMCCNKNSDSNSS